MCESTDGLSVGFVRPKSSHADVRMQAAPSATGARRFTRVSRNRRVIVVTSAEYMPAISYTAGCHVASYTASPRFRDESRGGELLPTPGSGGYTVDDFRGVRDAGIGPHVDQVLTVYLFAFARYGHLVRPGPASS